MNSPVRQAIAKGFTLIELLIVVVIIAILAAIAIPQFSNTSSEAQEAALDANLNSMRAAIELYRVQHNNKLPGSVATSGGTCTGGSAGTSDASTAEKRADALKESLTMFSNAAGQTCSLGIGAFVYGPYLRAVPKEPVTPSDAMVVITGADANPSAATGGWHYNATTGKLVMNSNATARDQRLYYQH
jgi:prepilin-type N-terminal cleavage/methylation domain-containing protein